MASKTALVVFLALVALQGISGITTDDLLNELASKIYVGEKNANYLNTSIASKFVSVAYSNAEQLIAILLLQNFAGKEVQEQGMAAGFNLQECEDKAVEDIRPVTGDFLNGLNKCTAEHSQAVQSYLDALYTTIEEAKDNWLFLNQSVGDCGSDDACGVQLGLQIQNTIELFDKEMNKRLDRTVAVAWTTIILTINCEYQNLQETVKQSGSIVTNAIQCFHNKELQSGHQ